MQVFRKQKIRKANSDSPACLKTCAGQLSSIFTLIFNRSLELCKTPPPPTSLVFCLSFSVYANELSLSQSDFFNSEHQESQPTRIHHSMHMAKSVAAHHLGHI